MRVDYSHTIPYFLNTESIYLHRLYWNLTPSTLLSAAFKKKKTYSMFLRILPYAKPYWRRLLLITILIAIMAGINQVEPFLNKQIIDHLIQTNGQGDTLPTILGIFLLAYLAAKLTASALNRLTWYMANIFTVKFESHLKQVGFDHLMNLSISFFNDQSSGKMMSKLDRGVNRIVNIVNNSGMHFLPSVTTAIVSLVIVTTYEWKITLSILAAFIPYSLINRWRFKRNEKLERQEYKLYDNHYSHFWEVLSSMSLVKAFRAENFERQKFTKFFQDLLVVRQEMENNTNKAVAGDLFLEAWNWAMYAYIVWMTWVGQISVGTLAMLIGLIGLIRQPLWQLNWIFWEVKRASIGAKDFFRIMDIQPDIVDPQNPVQLPELQGEITFEDIDFTYKNRSEIPEHEFHEDEEDDQKNKPTPGPQRVFDTVSLVFEAGKTTALVGPSGSGKTTVAQLVMRFFDPDSGRVLLDGIDIRQLRQRELRSYMGLVSQDPFLFATSLAENLRYAKPDATEEEMWAACRTAYAAEFIEKLPAKLETEIGDRGVKLSGGQRQRISLARTILANPRIIILDEATSALDSESEMYIQRALKQVLKNRTAIVIAHRLSTIQRADKIVVLKDHRVLEEGSHAELLKKDGLYASLYKIQSGDVEKLHEWDLVA